MYIKIIPMAYFIFGKWVLKYYEVNQRGKHGKQGIGKVIRKIQHSQFSLDSHQPALHRPSMCAAYNETQKLEFGCGLK